METGVGGQERDRGKGGEEGKDPSRLTGKARCLRSVIPAPRKLRQKEML